MVSDDCPDNRSKSAGVRILYHHVEVLNRHGFAAAVLHINPGFVLDDQPDVPVRYLLNPNAVHVGDTVVIPEGGAAMMLKAFRPPLVAVRRIIITLNWRLVYADMPFGIDWRSGAVERVITHSPFIADFVSWSMRLPTHVFAWGINGINPSLYFPPAEPKVPQVCYIARKQGAAEELKNVLFSRNPRFLQAIQWLGCHDLSESRYAEEVRRSGLFLNLSEAEGLPCSLLEAMRSRTLVAGYNSVGAQRELIGDGPRQNCILAENLDYVTLAQKLEPVLQAIIDGNLTPWNQILDNAYADSLPYTLEAEEASVVALWQQIAACTPAL